MIYQPFSTTLLAVALMIAPVAAQTEAVRVPSTTMPRDIAASVVRKPVPGDAAWAQAIEPTLAQLMVDKPIVDP